MDQELRIAECGIQIAMFIIIFLEAIQLGPAWIILERWGWVN